VVVDIGDGTVDGAAVIVALVHECDPSAKPCRVASTGKAYLRGYDGDFQLSHLEEQASIAARRPPMFDRAPVEVMSCSHSPRPGPRRRSSNSLLDESRGAQQLLGTVTST
jgi:hypothetical protein